MVKSDLPTPQDPPDDALAQARAMLEAPGAPAFDTPEEKQAALVDLARKLHESR